jgi:hypothetical protein
VKGLLGLQQAGFITVGASGNLLPALQIMEQCPLGGHFVLTQVKDGVEVRAWVTAVLDARTHIIPQQVIGEFDLRLVGQEIPGRIEIIIFD